MRTCNLLSAAQRAWGRLSRAVKDSRGLINTTDLMVAAGAAVILASGVAMVATEGMDQAKYGKAQPDAVAISSAMQAFFKDTGKWPGQVEFKATPATKRYLASGTVTTANLPTGAAGSGSLVGHAGAAVCGGRSLEGFSGTTLAALAAPVANTAHFMDFNDFLVKKPAEADYPNWKGPYLPADVRSDPWDRLWVINLAPLVCSEPIASAGASGGSLGFAWIVSGGSNRQITTNVTSARLDKDGDDTGVNLGKLITRSAGGADN